MTRVCDIRELPSVEALRAWARTHHATIRHPGPDATGRPVYIARSGTAERVARAEGSDPCSHPLVWRSPLETG